jgi:DNA-binding LytR/AlgR family response regulator
VKLRLHQRQELEETEIDIAYSRMTNRLSKMVGYIRQYTYMVEAFWNGKSFLIPLDEILYFDTTDRKTFLYTNKQVYECRKALIEVENELSNTTVIRISKETLLNTTALVNVRPYPNHRLMAELSNGENLIISRKYISILQNRLRSEIYVKSV